MSTPGSLVQALAAATGVLAGAGMVAAAVHEEPDDSLLVTADRSALAMVTLPGPLPRIGVFPLPPVPPPPDPTVLETGPQAHVDCQAPQGGGRVTEHRHAAVDGRAEASCTAEVTRSGGGTRSSTAGRAAAGSRTGDGAASRASSANASGGSVSSSATARTNVVTDNRTTANNTTASSTSASTSSSTSSGGGAATSSGSSSSSSSSSFSSFP